MAILAKAINGFNALIIKIPMSFFIKKNNNPSLKNCKTHIEAQKTPASQSKR